MSIRFGGGIFGIPGGAGSALARAAGPAVRVLSEPPVMVTDSGTPHLEWVRLEYNAMDEAATDGKTTNSFDARSTKGLLVPDTKISAPSVEQLLELRSSKLGLPLLLRFAKTFATPSTTLRFCKCTSRFACKVGGT